MYDQIRIGEFGSNRDGLLQQTAEGYFDFRESAGGANVRRLMLANITKEVDNVSATWQSTNYRPHITETEVFPPRYVGDRIVFFWSRPISHREKLLDVKAESFKALEAAIEAVISSGFDLMEYPG